MTPKTQAKVHVPRWRILGSGLLAALLSACGGGGGGEAEAEIVSVQSNGVLEGDSGSRQLEIAVTLSKPSVHGVSLSYWTDTASAPAFGFARSSDYNTALARYKNCSEDTNADYIPVHQGTPATLSINKGQSSGVMRIEICGDAVLEPNERFTVSWSSVATSQVSSRSVTAVILNDEAGALASTGIQSASPAVASSGSYVSRDDNPLTNDAADGPAGLAYAKLDTAGVELSITATTWSCLKDKVTGLVWRDGNALPTGTSTWDAVSTSAGTLCGRSDWRLPTVSELLSLVNNASSASSAVTAMQAGRYWTGDSSTAGSWAWFVDFGVGYGTVDYQAKSAAAHARLVSDPVAAPASRFTATGNVVLDNKTQLMWKRCAEGASLSTCASPQGYTWADAQDRVSTVNANPGVLGEGYSDWRLPNKNELASLLTATTTQPATPAFDADYFPNTTYGGGETYWSASGYVVGQPSTSGFKWYVNFQSRSVGYAEPGQGRWIRLVRGGQ